MYFCVDCNGELFILGNHGDWEAAEDTARSMGLSPIITFGEQTAKQWRNTLTNTEAQLED